MTTFYLAYPFRLIWQVFHLSSKERQAERSPYHLQSLTYVKRTRLYNLTPGVLYCGFFSASSSEPPLLPPADFELGR